MTNQLDTDIKEKKIFLVSKKKYKKELKKQLNQITSSKFYLKWQKINSFKRLLKKIVKNPVKSFKYLVNTQQYKNEIESQIQQNNLIININTNHTTQIKPDEIDNDLTIKFKYQPKISIIVPTYNTPLVFLTQCLDSVLNQTYKNWELCISDDNSTDKTTKQILKKYSSLDQRIKIVFRNENGHICKSSNSALKITTGEYIALLDHDDLLTPDALFEVVTELNKNPKIDYLYSDEDKLDEDGKTFTEPTYKPNWSVDKLFSFMYTGHLSVYKKQIIDQSNGFTIGTQGAQDYDLLLKSLKYIKTVSHIPKILYHWRKHINSTAMTLKSKPYAITAGQQVLSKYIPQYTKETINIINPQNGFYLINFKKSKIKETLVLINKKIKKNKSINNLKRRVKGIQFFNNIKDLNNIISNSNNKIFLIINDDIKINNFNELNNFINYLSIKNVGLIGPKITNIKGEILSDGIIINKKITTLFKGQKLKYGYLNNLATQSDVTSISSTFFAFTKSTYQKYIHNFNSKLPNSFIIETSIKLAQQSVRTVFYPQMSITNLTNNESIPRDEENILKQNLKNKFKELYLNPNITQKKNISKLFFKDNF